MAGKKSKTKYGYIASCRVTGCKWNGDLARNEREAKKLFFAHCTLDHLEIKAVPVKKKIVMELITD